MGQVKKETVNGAKWQLLQKLTLQPVQFIYSIILARLITPAEMGILGLTAIFFAVASCLASSGFATALIRKLDRTDEDSNTMFWFNLGMSALMSLILFLLAPWFVEFYHQPELLWLTRCSAALMLLSSTAGVHWALYTAQRNFKTPAIIQTTTALTAIPVGITMAYLGYGVWALMAQQIVSTLMSLIIVWYVSPWKPRFLFSKASFCGMFSFGSRQTAAALLHTIYMNLRTFIIGRFYSAADLGLFSKGNNLAALLPTTFSGMVMSVSFPVLVTLQNDLERLSHVYRTYIQTCTLPIAWVCLTLAALANPLISFLYGPTWIACDFFLQLAAFVYAFDHICLINVNLLLVLGRSDLILRLEIVKKSLSIALLFYAATISVEAICWSMVIYTQIAIVVNCYYTGKLIGINWWKQQKDYLPFFIIAGIAVMPSCILSYLTHWPDFVKLFLGGTSSFIIYFGYLAMRKDVSLLQYISILATKPILCKLLKKTGLMHMAS